MMALHSVEISSRGEKTTRQSDGINTLKERKMLKLEKM